MQSNAEREFILAALDLLLRRERTASAPADESKISVIIAVFDRGPMIEEALASLDRQVLRDFEAIVVDDGSTDGTAAILRRWAEKVQWLRVLTNVERQGQSSARNRALKAASGNIIVYLDSDNTLYPHALASIKDEFARSPEIWSIYTSQVWMGAGHEIEVRCPKLSLNGLQSMSVSFDLNAFAHRRSLFDVLGGFDERLSRLADLELAIRYAKLVMPRRVPIPTSHYRDGDWPRVSNRSPLGWNAHLVRETHAKQIAHAMRVLYVIHSYPQVSETYMVAEYRYMLSRGVTVGIWSEANAQAPDPNLPGTDPIIVFRGTLSDAIAKFRPDILHVHWANIFKRHSDVIEASGLPVTVRGHSFDFGPDLLDWLQQQQCVRRVYVFPTQYSLLSGTKERIGQAPVCFDPSMHQPSQEKDRRLVLRTGTALPTKDILSFIDLALRCPRHHFVLFTCRVLGNPGYLDGVLQENEANGSPVEIYVDRPAVEVASWMRRAGIYVHSYNPEVTFGMPISIAEALATGAYVLARRAPNIGEYAGCQARLFDDIEQAAELVNTTLEWDETRWAAERHLSIERAFLHHVPAIAVGAILDEWLSLTGSHYIEPREAQGLTTVRVDQTIFFGAGGEGVGMIREGFHHCENWGIWTAQRNAVIAMVTSGPDWHEVKTLSLEICGIPERVAPLALRISVNGCEVGQICIVPGLRKYDLTLTELALEATKILKITFEAQLLWTPADSGQHDRRRLGFGLRRLCFVSKSLIAASHSVELRRRH
jgi:glycosyltransferase involved in cell wall biosynthesis